MVSKKRVRLEAVLASAALVGALSVSTYAAPDRRGNVDGWGAGGFALGALKLDLGGLNAKLEANGFAPLNETVFIIGGGGSGGTKDWTIGGFGGGGEVTSVKDGRTASLSIGFGGMHVQRYTYVGSLALSGGLMLGGGGAEIRRSTGSPNDADAAIGHSYDTVLSSGFMALAPTAGVRIPLNEWIHLQAEGSYLFTVGKWEHLGKTITDLPSISGPMFRVGLLFGGSAPDLEKMEERAQAQK